MAAGWLIHPCRKGFAIALATALVLPFMPQRGIHQLKTVLRLLASLEVQLIPSIPPRRHAPAGV